MTVSHSTLESFFGLLTHCSLEKSRIKTYSVELQDLITIGKLAAFAQKLYFWVVRGQMAKIIFPLVSRRNFLKRDRWIDR